MGGIMDRIASPVGMAGMPFGWVFAFMAFAFFALMTAFYCGHKFSAPQVVYQQQAPGPVGPHVAPTTQRELKNLLEEAASKSKGLDAGMLDKINALGASIAKIERDFNDRAASFEKLTNEVVDGRKVIQATLHGMATSNVKGSGTMLDMTQTFDGEFKTMDGRFAEVATLLASIRDKQAEVAILRKVIGDGNDASRAALLQLNEKVNTLSAGVTQLAQVVRMKLPNPEDLKFGAEFPPPANQ
jgi:uncharacterized phage infection (PIP) family protein YhgE